MFSLNCTKFCRNVLQKSFSTGKVPIISCKRKQFDFYGVMSSKSSIALASDGWQHKNSRGDYFIVHRIPGFTNVSDSKKFNEIGICDEITNVLENKNISSPTNIQIKSIPVVLDGKNCLITAETGCGKTYAYLLPLLQQVMYWKAKKKERPLNTPLALILSPNRELSYQIYEVAKEICKALNIDVKHLTGGGLKKKMLNPTFENTDILIATPGALSKLVTTGIYKINHSQHVVLDEADSLLDDSFIDKMTYLLKRIIFSQSDQFNGCQLTLVSATIPRDASEILGPATSIEHFKKIISEDIHKTLPHVPQRFLRIGLSQKPIELLKLVRSDVNKKYPLLIFSNKSETCKWISMFLNENGINCDNLNADMPAIMRLQKYEKFYRGEVDVLSCTDIISRGMDTVRVKHVINYEFPLNTSDYIHRCGRIGRIGSSPDCFVTNFVSTHEEVKVVERIERSIREMTTLPSVNANIKKVIRDRVIRNISKAEKQLLSMHT